jgi:hypothetical protein
MAPGTGDVKPPTTSLTNGADRSLETIAYHVHRLGLEIPAVFLLEMQKPLARFAGHGLEMILPLVPPGWRERAKDFGTVLTDPRRLEELVHRIERG